MTPWLTKLEIRRFFVGGGWGLGRFEYRARPSPRLLFLPNKLMWQGLEDGGMVGWVKTHN